MVLFCVLFISLFIISQSVVIWEDPLNSTDTAYVTWTIVAGSGTVTTPWTDPAADCPNAMYCWAFYDASSAYYISPTTNFENITVTFTVSVASLDGTDSCNVDYSIDSSTSSWTTIAATTSTIPVTDTISLPL
eukprot:315176_1